MAPYAASELENLTNITSSENLSDNARKAFFEEIAARIRTFDGGRYMEIESRLAPLGDLWRLNFVGRFHGGSFDRYSLTLNETDPSNVEMSHVDLGGMSDETRKNIRRVVNETEDLRGFYVVFGQWDPDWGDCLIANLYPNPEANDSAQPFWRTAVDLENEQILAATCVRPQGYGECTTAAPDDTAAG